MAVGMGRRRRGSGSTAATASDSQADSFSWYQLSAAAKFEPSYWLVAAFVFFFVEVVVVVVVIIVVVFVVIGFVGPAFRLFGRFEVEFVPGVEVHLFDLTVEVLDFHELFVLVHGQDAEGFVFFLVLKPLARDRCVFSAHEFKPLAGGARV